MLDHTGLRDQTRERMGLSADAERVFIDIRESRGQ
jgi:hypothetical protein